VTAPLVVQSDGSILLETASEGAAEAREALARFAEIVKSPEHVQTWRLSNLSLWHAAGQGLTADDVVGTLARLSRYELPANVVHEIRGAMARFGRLVLRRDGEALALDVSDAQAAAELAAVGPVAEVLGARRGAAFKVDPARRGALKQRLLAAGWPVDDRAGFQEGAPVPIALRDPTLSGRPFRVRPYQDEAARSFVESGHGTVVLACGAGKTVVALSAMARLGTATLVLCTSTSAVHQWVREILDKTTLVADQVGEYTARAKAVRPVTVTTYPMLIRRKGDSFPHWEIFDRQAWGLIVYDEVHLVPAPLFRVTADLQARRRLGLTATLVREDGKEGDVYSLIGPKRYDAPWREMEAGGYIAKARCVEVRVDAAEPLRLAWSAADAVDSYRLAAENPRKIEVARQIVLSHPKDRVIVVGQYVRQVRAFAEKVGAPLVTGETPDAERERVYDRFRCGEISVLVASKVANFSIDLPEASVLVQLSGAFGSRQEEAQRLGRVLRPKERVASFYSIVTKDSPEQRFALNRQIFLAEQGYPYEIEDWTWVGGEEPPALPPAVAGGEEASA
jgi:DNA excision repair protein ERCC-3